MRANVLIERSEPPKPTLLLAEDSPEVARAFVRLLKVDFEMKGIVSDGESLIIMAERLRPDVIVTDIGLRGLDGISATKLIRERHPSAVIVVVTARTDAHLNRQAHSAGASAFVLKTNAHTLPDVLHTLLGGRSISSRNRTMSQEPASG
jgi:two-component system, NarL family, response regulator DesR